MSAYARGLAQKRMTCMKEDAILEQILCMSRMNEIQNRLSVDGRLVGEKVGDVGRWGPGYAGG